MPKTTLGLLLVAAAMAALLFAPPAQATKVHLFQETLGSVAQPTFEEITGLAYDPGSGDIVVLADGIDIKATIQRFKPNGEPHPFAALGTNTIDGKKAGTKTCAEAPASCDETPRKGLRAGSDPSTGPTFCAQIAIDDSGTATDGNIYVTQGCNGSHWIYAFAADGHYLGELTDIPGEEFEEPQGLAVDPAGNLYVSDVKKDKIYKFEPAANPPVNADGAVLSSAVERPHKLAAGTGPSAGALFVEKPREGSSTNGALYKLDTTSGAIKSTILQGYDSNSDLQTIAVDQTNGRLFALTRNPATPPFNVLKEFDASGASPVQLSATLLTALDALAAGGDIYTSAEYHPAPFESFRRIAVHDAPIVTVPAVATDPATELTRTRATLNGTLNADGVPLTECYFEYVGRKSYEEHGGRGTVEGGSKERFAGAKIAPCEGPLPADSADHQVQARIGEVPSEDVWFRLIAANAGAGHTVYGHDEDFTPTRNLKALPATDVTGVSATLNATVNPDGAPVTQCLFEYGTTTAYGNLAPCEESEAEIGEGEAPVPVHADITGLSPSTKYEWRVTAATIGSGTGGSETVKGTSFAAADPVTTLPATAIGGTSATLNGAVNPEGSPVTECLFEYGADTSYGATIPCGEYEAGGTWHPLASPAELGTGASPVAVRAQLSGLEGISTYHFRLRTSNGQGGDRSFLTGGPLLEEQWATDVTTTEAILHAQINPKGKATTYRLEYGKTGAPFEHVLPESAPIGSGTGAVAINLPLADLEPDTTYRYRFVATNADWSTPGPELAFTTYAPPTANAECPNQALRTGPAAALPDCRAYEMVSPVEKNGTDVKIGHGAEGETTVDLSAVSLSTDDGEAFTYIALGPPFGDPSAAPLISQYMAERDPAAGWGTRSISPPWSSNYFPSLPIFPSLQAFTPDLCQGWVFQSTDRPLAEGAPPGSNFYRTTGLRPACGEDAGYELLTPGDPPGTPPPNVYINSEFFYPVIEGFSADGSVSVFRANAKLTGDASSTNDIQLYVNSGGILRLLSVLPDGSPAGKAGLGDAAVLALEPQRSNVRHALSADGSRAFWTSDGLYLRVNPTEPQSAISGGKCTQPARACTIQIAPGGSKFVTADPDASLAFYTSKGSLYELDVDKAIAYEAGAATEVAAGMPGATSVLDTSEEASRIYFASTLDLGAGPNPEGDPPVPGESNLYLYERGKGFAFVGTLAGAIDRFPYALSLDPMLRSARVSPDGLHAAFPTKAPLTGYDNTDAAGGQPASEIFLYDAATGGAEAELRCVSCNPSGARPRGRFNPRADGSYAAATIPSWQSKFQPTRALSEDGRRLFFESYDALVLGDSNGAADVYQWEEAGKGDCSNDDATFFEANGGCLSLISSGRSPGDSLFIDASADGRDVFINTASSLVSHDPGLIDVYDARAGGGFPEPPPPGAPCEGEACQSPPEAPDDPTPASESFQGAGNVSEEAPATSPRRPCAKGKVRLKGRCVAKKHRAHKRSQKKQRAGHDRRADR